MVRLASHLAGGVGALVILLASTSRVEALPVSDGPAVEAEHGVPESVRAAAFSISPSTPDCMLAQEPQQQRQTPARRRHSRMFGWLWRSTRDVDIERTGAPLLFYLRSPLLTAIPERTDCEHELAEQEPSTASTCASLAVNPGQDDAYSVAVTLPQLAASSPARLAANLRNRLDKGESVTLRALGGAAIELNPDRIRQVHARACVADA